MVAATKFEAFVGHLGLKGHNLNTDTLNVALCSAAESPTAANRVEYGDLTTEVANGNGYTTGGEDVTNTYSEASGTGTCDGTDIVWTASGGTIPLIRYAVLYNDTMATSPADKGVIAFWDYGSEIAALADGETFTFNIVTNLFTIA